MEVHTQNSYQTTASGEDIPIGSGEYIVLKYKKFITLLLFKNIFYADFRFITQPFGIHEYLRVKQIAISAHTAPLSPLYAWREQLEPTSLVDVSNGHDLSDFSAV